MKLVRAYMMMKSKNDEVLDDMLREKIPDYMIPNIKIRVEEFPYNANGKVDRKRLKESYLKM